MRTTQPGATAHAASYAARRDEARGAQRRIDCGEVTAAVERAAPARGGGMRDPQERRQPRSARG